MSSGSSAPRIPCRCSSVLRVPWCCGSYSWCVRSVTQGYVFVDPRRKPPPLPSKSFPFHFSTGASKTCAIDETRHCGEVLKLSPTCPARCADCSGSPPDAPPFSIVGRLDTASDFPQPHTTVRWLVFGLLMITFWARLTMITADIISSWLSSGKHSSEMDMVSLILAKSQRIYGGFIGPFELRIMIYLLVMKSFPLDSSGTSWLLVLPSSHKEWISYLLSMKGYTFSVLLLNSGFSFSTGMSSCVAVSTVPEEATEITFGFLVGESWLSTSHYVTIFQLVVKNGTKLDTYPGFKLCEFRLIVDYRTQFKPNLSPDSKHFGSDNTVSLESVVFFVLHPTADHKNHPLHNISPLNTSVQLSHYVNFNELFLNLHRKFLIPKTLNKDGDLSNSLYFTRFNHIPSLQTQLQQWCHPISFLDLKSGCSPQTCIVVYDLDIRHFVQITTAPTAVSTELFRFQNYGHLMSLAKINTQLPESGDKEEATSTDQRESDENNQQTTDRQ
ncbi:hypothetical protein YC2023_013414 [Brassica napus]